MKNKDKAAFPCATSIGYNSGLTKREYFAAMAMQGIVGNSGMVDIMSPSCASICAEFAATCADAILSELDKTESK